MSHHSAKESYKSLHARLNRHPQGAPSSPTLYKILSVLFDEKDAELIAQLPVKPFIPETAARIWKRDLRWTRLTLEKLAQKALLLDMNIRGEQRYVLPPPMAGFFEFSLMRIRSDVDQKALSELFYQYLNVEEDFIKALFFGTETRMGRVFVHEGVLTSAQAVHILDYERASHIIEVEPNIAVGMCYCRHKMQHVGHACSAPMDICMSFNNVASSLIKHGHARRIDKIEARDLLQLAYENDLVQCGENVKKQPSFLCNCCGCCCEALIAARKFGHLHPVHTSPFLPQINEANCSGCGKCVKVCPIGAVHLIKQDSPTPHENWHATVDESTCLGCGICAKHCAFRAIDIVRRPENIITPTNSVHRIVLMAIEKGQLDELVFDNKALFSHRMMGAILSAVLKLPPMKRALANEQLKSVYLDRLIQVMDGK